MVKRRKVSATFADEENFVVVLSTFKAGCEKTGVVLWCFLRMFLYMLFEIGRG